MPIRNLPGVRYDRRDVYFEECGRITDKVVSGDAMRCTWTWWQALTRSWSQPKLFTHTSLKSSDCMINIHPIQPTDAAPWTWVDLCRPDGDELVQASQTVGFEIPGRTRISEIEYTSRVRRSGQALILNLPRFEEGGDADGASLGFALSPNALVVQREQRLESLDAVIHDLTHHPSTGPVDLFLRLLECIVDKLADHLESLEARVSDTTRSAYRSRHRGGDLERMLRDVGDMGRKVGLLHNSVHGLLRITGYLEEVAPPWFAESSAQRIRLVHKDLVSLGEFEQQLGERIEFLLDSVLGLINMDQNEVMKVMAIASVVGIPPTVLVGIWGMNFATMPELHWHNAYYWALAAIGLSIVAPLLWFKRRGWL